MQTVLQAVLTWLCWRHWTPTHSPTWRLTPNPAPSCPWLSHQSFCCFLNQIHKTKDHGLQANAGQKKKKKNPDWIRERESSGSNWILMSCQPHRVTSGQSNSGHKQIHISKLFSHYISTLCQVNLQNQSLHKHKTYINKHQAQIFEELVPSMWHAGIVDHSV